MGEPRGRTCTEPDCHKPWKAMGLCAMHYARHRKTFGLLKRPKPKRKPVVVPEVVALYSWPDRHHDAPGGQRLVRWPCPFCHSEHLASWLPLDEHPGEKYGTCLVGPHGGASSPKVIVLAPPASAQLDHEPPRSVVLGEPTQRNQWTDA